jgi:hypothetical protein
MTETSDKQPPLSSRNRVGYRAGMERPFDAPEVQRIRAFLSGIGIEVVAEPLQGETFLPGMTVHGGAIVVDPDRLEHPGDLLHEAGHIAVTDPALRPALDGVADDPGEEMAAIA